MFNEKLYTVDGRLGDPQSDDYRINPEGPSAKQLELCRRLNNECAFRDTGEMPIMLTEERLEKYAIPGVPFKLRFSKRAKKADYIEKFLEDMLKFFAEIFKTYGRASAVSAYRSKIKSKLNSKFEKLTLEEQALMLPHLERYKDELDKIKQEIKALKLRLKDKNNPVTRSEMEQIQEELDEKTLLLSFFPKRFMDRVAELGETLDNVLSLPPAPPKLRERMKMACYSGFSEAGGFPHGNAFTDLPHKAHKPSSPPPKNTKPNSGKAQWTAMMGGEAGGTGPEANPS